MIDSSHASLESRLDNWANAARGPHDPIDAVKIEAAWRCLEPHYKELLRMVYLWRAGREVVCRRLKIARHPRSRYDLELASARRALARLLEQG
ncbi:hypothetical protein [Paraburkholderia silvatlantica]|uniref:DUF3263 domain-containing protein n=1 Tax=Paraburkholderia silvatlantica TaxID=321895 RepID=A0ABR6FX35_9BURK|nr:hypothetical protein [Paraburkholderia silvatlantica]MBB2931999.1 hypothetical protein [Paraburkholderia silvatlantica]PVY24674.1 hypothetical protein C7411_12763 [Paraburkholderia silvatlantica]PXW31170.1 hypothetical protein C7413_12663 [Paraburkholderia silvatlantica]